MLENNDIENLISQRVNQVPVDALKNEDLKKRKNIELHINIESFLKEGKDADAIKLTTELQDLQQNIFWAEAIPANANDPAVIIRDARAINDKHPGDYDYLAYACHGFHTIRACRKIFELEEKLTPENDKLLNNLALQFWKTIRTTKSNEELAILNKCLLRAIVAEITIKDKKENESSLILSESAENIIDEGKKKESSRPITSKEAAEYLQTTKDFANLETPTPALATLNQITVDEKTPTEQTIQYFEIDVPLTTLTEEQIKEYNERKEKKDGKDNWYTSLPPWQKKLVDKYWEDHLSHGNRVIPNTLRDCMVGCRNSYKKLRGSIVNDVIEIDNENMHSGTIAHLNKKIKNKPDRKEENQRITDLNAKQLELFADNSKVHLLTLNSEYNSLTKKINNNDRKIVKQSRIAVGNVNENDKENINGVNHYSNLAMNFARRITPNDYQGADFEINAAAELIKNDDLSLVEIKKYLKAETKKAAKESEFKRVYDLIIKPDCPEEYRKLFKAAITAKHLISNNSSPFDKNNRNSKIVNCLNNINHEIRKFNPNHPKIIYACQSGKDRTGVVEFNNLVENVLYKMKKIFSVAIDFIPKRHKAAQASLRTFHDKLLVQTARSGHQRFMAGFFAGGGSTGCNGVKSDSSGSFPESYPKEVVDFLIRPTASLNKELFLETKQDFLMKGKKLNTTQDWILYTVEVLQYRLEQTRKELDRSSVYKIMRNLFRNKELSEERVKLITQTISDVKNAKNKDALQGIITKAKTDNSQLTKDISIFDGKGKTQTFFENAEHQLDKAIKLERELERTPKGFVESPSDAAVDRNPHFPSM